MIVCSALMIWKSLMVVTESDSPVVVVLRCAQASQGTAALSPLSHESSTTLGSGSMEPAFYRGDILFLHMGGEFVFLLFT